VAGDQLILTFDGVPALLSVAEIYENASFELIARLKEDRRLERKPAGYQPRYLADYISMFANTKPDGGIIVLGMENNGEVVGCSHLNQDRVNELERAGQIYCPDARYESKRVKATSRSGKPDFLIVLRVSYREDRVVKTGSGEAYVRLGESKEKLTAEQIRELEIDRGQLEFEQEPCGLSYPTDFDLALITQFCHGIRTARKFALQHTDTELLELRHLGRRSIDGFVPNNACALLFASDPLAKFAGCKIRFLRFDGEHEGTGEKFNAVKDITVEGCVPRLVENAEKVVEQQIRDFSRMGKDGKFYTAPEYPKAAWYEAIVNACVHRSYGLRNMNVFVKMFDDRLVIESPGGFPPLVTPENIYNVHHPRNPYLMDAMLYLDFVKAANEGTRRMRQMMSEMNLPLPEFVEKDHGYAVVRVTLRNDLKHRRVWVDSEASALIGEALSRQLSQHELRVINWIAENKSINVSQVQRLTEKTWPASRKLLDNLTEKGILQEVRRAWLTRDTQARFVLRNKR
jgi:ATP-dependent DNA helicase RecG